MRVLAVPNWSFGRDKALLRAFRDTLADRGLAVHYNASELDHNRTVTAFSGEASAVNEGLLALCDLAFPACDLGRHAGSFPRTGALDLCPLIPLERDATGFDFEAMQPQVDALAKEIAKRHELPVYLFGKSDHGRNEAELARIAEGGFGGLWDRELDPDFGPRTVHPRLGVSILGARDFFATIHIDLKPELLEKAKVIVEEIHALRQEGDPRFLGVQALATPIPTYEAVQVCLSAGLPDLTPLDPIVEYVVKRGLKSDLVMTHIELVGAIRPQDLEASTYFPHKPEQVVEVALV